MHYMLCVQISPNLARCLELCEVPRYHRLFASCRRVVVEANYDSREQKSVSPEGCKESTYKCSKKDELSNSVRRVLGADLHSRIACHQSHDALRDVPRGNWWT